MAEHRYGYMPPPHPHPHDTAARLKSMDRALRAEILSNARRQYEAATRALRLRTQAEAHAQAKTQALAHVHAQTQAQARYGHLENASLRPIPSSSSGIVRPTSRTPSTDYQQRRPVQQFSTSASYPVDENALGIDELKRRYYAQLSDTEAPSNSRDTYPTPRPYNNTVVNHVRSQYPRVGARGQVRTMADEYLDFYMPARRGPHSSQNHQSHQEAPRRQETEHKSPQATRYQDVERDRFRRYLPEADRRNVLPETPVQRAGTEQPLRPPAPEIEKLSVRPRSSKGKLAFVLNPTTSCNPKASPRPAEQRDSPADRCPPLSERGADEGQPIHLSHSRQRSSDSKERSSLHAYQDFPRESHMHRRTPPMFEGSHVTSHAAFPSSAENDGEDWPSDHRTLSRPPHPKDIWKLDMQARAAAKSVPQELLRATYSQPTKRKASPPPQSPVWSEASTEYHAADGAPRAKRRAFGRLPAEYDSQSELDPEEEQVEGCSAQISESRRVGATLEGEETDGLGKVSRHNIERSVTGERGSLMLKLDTARRRSSASTSSYSPMSLSSSPLLSHLETTSPECREAKPLHERADDEKTPLSSSKREDTPETVPGPAPGLEVYVEVSERHRSSETLSDESKKHHFRP